MGFIKDEHQAMDNDLDNSIASVQQQYQFPSANVPFRASATPNPPFPTLPTTNGSPPSATHDSGLYNNGDIDMPDAKRRDAMRILGSRSRRLIQTIQHLEAMNIKAAMASLPKFIVIGDQSAGKSSIIEALCDIHLPRSEGTCTRCPFKITTSAKDVPWSCKVELQKLYAYTPRPPAKKVETPFENWLRLSEPEHYTFALVHDKQQLDSTLRQAQLAILNPLYHPSHFVNVQTSGSKLQDQSVGFSPNVIHLEITAPRLPELSFYDLPGAINTIADEEQQHLVDFVEALLKTYIGDEGAFIVLACAANHDIEISTALRFVRACQAMSRSMVVLTKPDLMDHTEMRMRTVQQLLAGETGYKPGGGVFVTRQLSQKQLDNETPLTYEDARQIEADFFAGEPWSTTLAAYQNRFGIPNLQQAVSEKLKVHILDRLPLIMERVTNRMSSLEDELKSFPPKALAPHITVNSQVLNVVKAMTEQVNADNSKSTLRKPYRDVFRSLRKKFEQSKPMVVVGTPGHEKPVFSLGSDDEDESPTKRLQLGNGRTGSVTPAPSSSKSARQRKTPANDHLADEINGTAVAKTKFHLDQIKVLFDSAPGADIPGQTSEAVVRDLIFETLTGWNTLVNSALRQIKKLFTASMVQTLNTALAQYDTTQLFHEIHLLCQDLFKELLNETCSVVNKLLSAELHRPVTHNTLLTRKKSEYETSLQSARRLRRVEEWFDNCGKIPSQADLQKKVGDTTWFNQNIGVDEYDREIKSLATPLAYYDIAYARLVDCIATQFEYGLMHKYEQDIHIKLLEGLQTDNVEKCTQLLAEDPARERKRAELEAEREKLMKALEELRTLPEVYA